MIVTLDGTVITDFADVYSLVPYDQDLAQEIGTAAARVVDQDGTIPKTPDYFQSLAVFEDDGVTQRFGGYVSELEELSDLPVGRAWALACRDWNARAVEASTGALDKSGVTDTDRNFVIAIMRSAMQNSYFGAASSAGSPGGPGAPAGGIDDAILTANEPNWPGVKATAFMSGANWSYKGPKNALADVRKTVPNVSWRFGHDKILKYGVLRERAPFDLATDPDNVQFFQYGNYRERVVVADHVNKMHRGGAAASDVTAYDEASHARFHRILEAPYSSDTSVPSSDLKRRTYAELQSRRVRRIAECRMWRAGLRAGMEIDIYGTRLGAWHPEGPQVDFFNQIYGREAATKLPKGYRGRFLIQKISQGIDLDGKVYWDLSLGDPLRDFATDLAAISNLAA